MADEQKVEVNPEEAATIDTGWENPPELSDLKQNYSDAAPHHDAHVTEVNTWLDNLHVKGAAKAITRVGRSSITPHLIRKQAEWRYASLSESFLSHEDIFTTDPVTFEDKDAAVQNGLVLNNQFSTQINKVAFIDEYVRAAVDEGSIVVRVGWVNEEAEVEVPNMVVEPITDDFMIRSVEQAAQALLSDPQAAQQIPPQLLEIVQLSLEVGTPSRLVKQGTKLELQTIKNQPTLEVCDYASLTIDPTCKGVLPEAQFIIYAFDTSKGALEKEGDRYSNLEEVNYERSAVNTADNNSSHTEDTGDFNFKDPARKQVRAYEYWGFWDIDNSGIPKAFVATWIGDTLIRMERSPFPNNELPFVLVQYLPRRKSVYGEPDGALLVDNQKISGAVTRGMIDMMGRSAAGQVGYRKDALDITNKRLFNSGQDYSYNAGVDPRLAFYNHTSCRSKVNWLGK